MRSIKVVVIADTPEGILVDVDCNLPNVILSADEIAPSSHVAVMLMASFNCECGYLKFVCQYTVQGQLVHLYATKHIEQYDIMGEESNVMYFPIKHILQNHNKFNVFGKILPHIQEYCKTGWYFK